MILHASDDEHYEEAKQLQKDYLEQFNLQFNESPFIWIYVCDFEEAFETLKTRKGRKIEVYHPPMQCDGGFLYHGQPYFRRRLKKEVVSEEDFDNYYYQLLDKKKLIEEQAHQEIEKLEKINQDYLNSLEKT